MFSFAHPGGDQSLSRLLPPLVAPAVRRGEAMSNPGHDRPADRVPNLEIGHRGRHPLAGPLAGRRSPASTGRRRSAPTPSAPVGHPEDPASSPSARADGWADPAFWGRGPDGGTDAPSAALPSAFGSADSRRSLGPGWAPATSRAPPPGVGGQRSLGADREALYAAGHRGRASGARFGVATGAGRGLADGTQRRPPRLPPRPSPRPRPLSVARRQAPLRPTRFTAVPVSPRIA
jgi:hypothetical protein